MRTNMARADSSGTRGARKWAGARKYAGARNCAGARSNTEARPTRLLGDAGSTLVAVIAIVTSVLLVGAAIFALGTSESDVVEYMVDDARAFYVAEGGLERARGWLGGLLESDPNANPVGVSFEGQLLGGGQYTVSVTDDLSGGGWLPVYEVISAAELDGVTRELRTVMVSETYARYQWYSSDSSWKWFQTGERFEGPVHVNGQLKIDGDPWFESKVTAGEGLNMANGGDPTFEQGYELNVADVPMPDGAYLHDVLEDGAMNGGLYAGTLMGTWSFYWVRLGEPSPGQLTYEGLRPKAGGYQTIDGPHVVDLSALNGALWFEEPIALEGVLDGQITIGANGDVEIWDDVLYEGSTPGAGPDTDCDDMLGIVADGDIIISYTNPNKNDCEVHGVLMALDTNIEAEDYSQYAPRGEFVLYGGLLAEMKVQMGKYSNGACVNGYERDYHYDARLVRTPPPHFPMTGRYLVYSWEETTPPEA